MNEPGPGCGSLYLQQVSLGDPTQETGPSAPVDLDPGCGGGGSPPPDPADDGFLDHFHHRDHLGSLRLVTDEAGGKVAGYDWYPYGLEMATTAGQTAASRWKYTVHERDEQTGLDSMWACYKPAYGVRFLSPDPADDVGLGSPQSWNRYPYVQGRAISAVDPDGRRLSANPDCGLISGCPAGSGLPTYVSTSWIFTHPVFGVGSQFTPASWPVGAAVELRPTAGTIAQAWRHLERSQPRYPVPDPIRLPPGIYASAGLDAESILGSLADVSRGTVLHLTLPIYNGRPGASLFLPVDAHAWVMLAMDPHLIEDLVTIRAAYDDWWGRLRELHPGTEYGPGVIGTPLDALLADDCRGCFEWAASLSKYLREYGTDRVRTSILMGFTPFLHYFVVVEIRLEGEEQFVPWEIFDPYSRSRSSYWRGEKP